MSRFVRPTLLGGVALAALMGLSGEAVAQTTQQQQTTTTHQTTDKKTTTETHPPIDQYRTKQTYTLEDRVEFRLETSDVVRKYDVKVDVDDKGVVTLSGDVATAAQKAEAERIAKVDGVTRVVNNIKVDPDEDASLAERSKNGLNKAGEKISDAWITTKVKWFFIGEDLLKDSDIDADTSNGVVTLKGTVKTDAGKRRAVALTQHVDGVKRVVDQMTIGR